mgnify:CR=1 FL=1
MNKDLVLVIDFGGQYSQLIARRVRECGIYCEIIPYTYNIEKIKEKSPKGMIFTGGLIVFMVITHQLLVKKYLI